MKIARLSDRFLSSGDWRRVSLTNRFSRLRTGEEPTLFEMEITVRTEGLVPGVHLKRKEPDLKNWPSAKI